MRKLRKVLKILQTLILTMVALSFIITLLCPLSCFLTKTISGIEVVGPNWLMANEQKTIIHSYTIQNDSVYYQGELCLRNTTDEKKVIVLKLFHPMDMLTGLLRSPILDTVDKDGKPLYFSLEPYETKTYNPIFFQGEKGSGTKRWSPLMPAVLCMELTEEDAASLNYPEAQGDLYSGTVLPTPSPSPAIYES